MKLDLPEKLHNWDCYCFASGGWHGFRWSSRHYYWNCEVQFTTRINTEFDLAPKPENHAIICWEVALGLSGTFPAYLTLKEKVNLEKSR